MKKLIYFVLLSMGISLLLTTFLSALEIRLNPPKKFYKINENIYINLTSRDSLLKSGGEIVQNLYYDIPVTITYYIEFYEDEPFFDKKLVNIALVRRVSYDHWSQQFFVEEGNNLFRYRNLTQLRNNIINLKQVKLIEVDRINLSKEYYFKTRIAVKIKNFTLYYYLINNLISIFKYKTTYYVSPMYSGKQIFQMSGTSSMED